MKLLDDRPAATAEEAAPSEALRRWADVGRQVAQLQASCELLHELRALREEIRALRVLLAGRRAAA